MISHFVKCWLSSFCSTRREEPAAHAQSGKLIPLHSDVLVLSTWSGQTWGLLGTSGSWRTSWCPVRFPEKLTIYRLCQHCCLNSQGGRDRQQRRKVLALNVERALQVLRMRKTCVSGICEQMPSLSHFKSTPSDWTLSWMN